MKLHLLLKTVQVVRRNAHSKIKPLCLLTQRCLRWKERFDVMLGSVTNARIKSHLVFKAVSTQNLQLEDFLLCIFLCY